MQVFGNWRINAISGYRWISYSNLNGPENIRTVCSPKIILEEFICTLIFSSPYVLMQTSNLPLVHGHTWVYYSCFNWKFSYFVKQNPEKWQINAQKGPVYTFLHVVGTKLYNSVNIWAKKMLFTSKFEWVICPICIFVHPLVHLT